MPICISASASTSFEAVITEKAIYRYKREFENKLKGPAKEEVEINLVVKEMIDAAQADEVAAEKLPLLLLCIFPPLHCRGRW